MPSIVFSVICLSLGIVLVFASLAKLRSFHSFRDTVRDITNFSESIVKMLSLAVIVLELALGISFLFGIALQVTFWVCLVVMLVMTGMSRIQSTSKPEALCLCFGQDGVLANSWKSISRSILIIVGTIAGLSMLYWLPNTQLATLSLEIVAFALVALLLFAWVTDLRLHHE